MAVKTIGRTMVEPLKDKIVALHMPKDITDDEIDELIRKQMPKVFEAQQGCVCSIYGYEFDERDVFEIPEAIELCKRLVARGFISMMYVNTMADREEKPYLGKNFGAFEVWCVATGNIGKDGFLPPDVSDVFLRDLEKANKQASKLFFTTDGQHRTAIR